MRQIFLDTETTGLNPVAGDRIIEIGCVEMVNRKLTGNNLHHYLNPGRESHEEALKVHGITSEFLRDKPRFERVVSDLLEYLKDAEVIIHNAAFDVGFLNVELSLVGQAGFAAHVSRVVDTLAMAKEMFPGKRNSLDALCDRMGVDRSGRTIHGALLDAQLLADVYINLTRGQDALLMDAGCSDDEMVVVNSIDFGQFDLPVLHANTQELVSHEEVINQIDKASGGKTLWRKVA